jgi:uncharacterized protein (TIGR04222 family)
MIEILYFISLPLICIACWYWANADGTKMYPLPELTRFDAVAIANLRGGWAAVIRTVVFSLWRRNLVEIEIKKHSLKKDEILIESVPSQKKVLGPIEKEIYQSLVAQRQVVDLFKDTGLRSRIEQHLEPTSREFEQLHLIRTEADHIRAWTGTIIMALGIGAGVIWFLIRIFSFPPILILIGVPFWVLKPKALPTQLGRRYLKALEENFGWVQESLKSGGTPTGIDAAFAIAIFGVGALSGVSLYGPFTQAFPTPKSGGCGGGCGGCGG